MTSKDFLYLGLIAVAALVCYCHGFFSGVNRARKLYESLLGPVAPEVDPAETEYRSADDGERANEQALDRDWTPSRFRSRLSGQDLRGDFGNN